MSKKRRGPSAKSVRKRVESRAQGRCEYCHAPQLVSGYRFHVEHVVPRSRGGPDALSNRALACATCNLVKADKMTAIDPLSQLEIALFNPRTQVWDEHFRWADDKQTLVGITAIGRATVAGLDMNGDVHQIARQLWFATGWLP